MTHTPPNPNQLPRIQTPCPKRWEELVGGDKKRFCSECCLHVHNGSELTRAEASSLVVNATERVCMRLEFDPSGAPLFRDMLPLPSAVVAPRVSFPRRTLRWAASAAVGLLAACTRSAPVTPTCDPALVPGTTTSTNIMGKIALPSKMGDVAAPAPPPPEVRMGEIFYEPPPVVDSPPPPTDPR